MARKEVFLNVYDMFWTNNYTTALGIGVYHSGLAVYGTEYAFGGHPYPFTGIFEITPRDEVDLGVQFKFKESISLGFTDFEENDIIRLIDQLGNDFKGDSYHLIKKNCNHFTTILSRTICGNEPPSWVNRLASVGSYIPMLEKAIPKEWLTPIALETAMTQQTDDNLHPSGNYDPTSTCDMSTSSQASVAGDSTSLTYNNRYPEQRAAPSSKPRCKSAQSVGSRERSRPASRERSRQASEERDGRARRSESSREQGSSSREKRSSSKEKRSSSREHRSESREKRSESGECMSVKSLAKAASRSTSNGYRDAGREL